MENLHLPHDVEPTDIGHIALLKQLDELFLISDREVARILSQFLGNEDE